MVRAGYFVRGEEPPQGLDPRYDVVVLQWRQLWTPEATEVVQSYKATGIEVHVHVPFAYLNPANDTTAHQAIRAILDEEDGWLKGADGVRVGDCGDKFLIDPRRYRVRRPLLKAHMDVLDDAAWKPDGLFLDFVWDEVAWKDEFRPWSASDRALLNAQYKTGMYQFVAGLRFALQKAGHPFMDVYGNGWHRCTACDGPVVENFPFTKQVDGERNLDIALNGYYGQDTWFKFNAPPMFMPSNEDENGQAQGEPGYNVPPKRVVQAVGFANSFAQEDKWASDPVVFDNSGYIFDVIGRL